jgi:hypothetical protein
MSMYQGSLRLQRVVVLVVEEIVASLVEGADVLEGAGEPRVEEDGPEFEVFPVVPEVVLADGVGRVVVVEWGRRVVEGVGGVVVGTTTGASVTGGVGGGRTRM